MSPPIQHLFFHGSLVLFFGLCLGGPYARAIKKGAPPHIVNSWRVAHASLPLGALLMFAVGSLFQMLGVGLAMQWAIAGVLIVSGYAFCIATSLAALSGQRGLDREASQGWGRVVYTANVIGALTSLVAAAMLVVACGMSFS